MYDISPDDVVVVRLDGQGNRMPNIAAAHIITFNAALIAVALRFQARRISKARLWWDDWLMVPAVASSIGTTVLLVFWWEDGGGRYIGAVTRRKLRVTFLIVFITEILYAIGTFLVRFSVLMLYRRLFHQKWTRRYCSFWLVVNSLWTIAAVTTVCLQCQPTSGFWERLTLGPVCNVDLKKFYLGGAISNILIDLAILALPLVLCWRLNLNQTAKLCLLTIFATGFFVTVVSGLRIQAVLNANLKGLDGVNATWTFAPTGMWSVVELNVGIVSACMPCLRPLLAKVIPSILVPKRLRKKSFIPYSIRKRIQSKRKKNFESGAFLTTTTVGGETTLVASNAFSGDDNNEEEEEEAAEDEGYNINTSRLKKSDVEPEVAHIERSTTPGRSVDPVSDAESGVVEIAPGVLGSSRWIQPPTPPPASQTYVTSSFPRVRHSEEGILVEQSVQIRSEPSVRMNKQNTGKRPIEITKPLKSKGR